MNEVAIEFGSLPRPEGAFVAEVVENIQSKEELLSCLRDRLHFPEFIGKNWDALFDALKDLSWIDQKYVVISHVDLLNLEERDLRIYLDLLNEGVLGWGHNENHLLIVDFPANKRDAVTALLNED